ncbi:MAG: hypothetical protein ABIA21_02695 [Candidatus Aenigmatarchaeota archaeon]
MSAGRTILRGLGILLLIIGIIVAVFFYSLTQVMGPEIVESITKTTLSLSPVNQTQIDQMRFTLQTVCNGSSGMIDLPIPSGTTGTVLNASVDCSQVSPMMSQDMVYSILAAAMSDMVAQQLKQQLQCDDFIACLQEGQFAVMGTDLATGFMMNLLYLGLVISLVGLVMIFAAREFNNILKSIGIALVVAAIILFVGSSMIPAILMASVPVESQPIIDLLMSKLSSSLLSIGVIIIVIGLALFVIGSIMGKKPIYRSTPSQSSRSVSRKR